VTRTRHGTDEFEVPPLQGVSVTRTIRGMVRRVLAFVAAGLVLAGVAVAADAPRTVEANGISLRVPAEWIRVPRADNGFVGDPRTLLVVGTKGVRPTDTDCLVASYRVPADGAAVVVIGWKGKLSTHYVGSRGTLVFRELERGYFECFSGRGLAAQIDLDGRTYQVNVMIGDRAERADAAEALAVARSLQVAD
jgi:hypothetical protein